MATMTKVLKRQISADERVRRFFERERRDYSLEMMKRWRLARVEQEADDGGVIRVLQVVSVYETGDGVIMRVR